MAKQNPLHALYEPSSDSHKGENGKLLVIGGSERYFGAPIFSLKAARSFVDLLYFMPSQKSEYLSHAVASFPEVIIRDYVDPSYVDCILYGIGIGDILIDERLLASKKLVIDGEGLRNIPAERPTQTLITPHEGEFAQVFKKKGTVENVKAMAREHAITILKKDPKGDIISDGERVVQNKVHHVGLTKGGTGDALSGLAAAFLCKNAPFESAYAASYLLGSCAVSLSKSYSWAYCTSDVIERFPIEFCRLRQKY